MTINCPHPRPKLNLPGYTPPRYSWQPPTFLPSSSLADLSRALTEQFRGVYAVLQQVGQRRTVVPLIEDINARAGQVIVGVGAGQVIRLPLGGDGELGQIGVVLTDVSSPVTIVNPDGTTQTLGTAGAYDFVSGLTDTYQTNPGGTVLGGGIPTDRLLGRDSAGTGAFESISVTGGLEFSGSLSIRIADLGVSTAKIAASAVTNAKLANMAAGRLKGVQVDGATGDPQDLTGAEVSELTRRTTIQTVSGVSGTLDIQLNDDTTVLLIRTTGDATLRTLETSTISDQGREIVIEHDRLSGTGTLTIPHNSAGTYSRFFNPDTSDLYLGQTTCLTVRFRSGFWRPQGSASRGFVFPGAPIYDVMRPPYNAVGNGIADDTAAINAAIAAANAVAGTIYLGNRHLISGALTPVTRDAIFIRGRGARGDGTLITVTGATPYNVFTFDTVKDCGLADVFIEAPGTWASRGLGVFIDDCFRTRIERVEITDTYGGIEIYASVITEIIDTYLSDTLGPYGFYAYGSAADGENHALRFVNCATGGNLGGTIAWYKQGSESHTFELINCGALEGGYGLYVADDTPYTDSSPRFTRCLNFQADHCQTAGIYLVAGATASFTHCFITSTIGGNAFHVTSGYSGNWELNGGMLHATAGNGAYIQGDHWSITGVQIGNIDAGFDMIKVDSGSTDFSITGCTLGDIFGDNSSAAYGINLHSTCDRFTISGNRIIGNDTGAINNPAGPATSRVIQGNTPTSVNTVRIDEIETMTAGTVIGKQVDAATGRPVALSGAEQAENWRRATIQTVSGVSGTLDILLNDDTTVLLIRTTADATLRSLGDGLATAGREIVIEHDRLSGSGNLTIQHNGGTPTYSAFFNPDTTNIVLGQTTCCTVRLRSGFWRPQGGAQLRIRDADYGDITVSSSGATWTIDNDVVTDAKLRNSAAVSVIGRSANSTGDPADIAAAADDRLLARTASSLAFQQLTNGMVPTNTIGLDKLANIAVGTVLGRQIDAGSTGAVVALTGAEQGENFRTNTRQTVSVSGTQDIALNDDTTILVLQLTADTTLRSLNSTATGDGRLIRIEHDSGAFTLTIQHNGATPTFSPFFNPNLADIQIMRGAILTVRSRSGFWRPEHPGGQMRVRKNSTGTVFNRGRINLIEGTGVTLTVADDSTNDEVDVTVAASLVGVTDGDKGDITVTASGATWTVDTNIAKTWTGVHRHDTYVQFGDNTGLPGAGDIRKGTGADLVVNAAANLVLNADTTSGTVDVNGSAIQFDAAASGAPVKTGQLLVFRNQSGTNAYSVQADEVGLYASNTHNGTLRWKDGAGGDWRIGYGVQDVISALTTRTNSTTPLTLASYTIAALELASPGACFCFRGAIQCARGSTATAVNVTLEFRVAGTQRFANASTALNTTNGFTGMAIIEGYFSVLGTGAAAAYTVVGSGWSQTANNTPAIIQPVPSIALTIDTTAAQTIDIRAFFSAAVANTSFTQVMGSIQRVF